LLKGAERKITDNEGKTAMDIAQEQNSGDIIAMLRNPSCLALFGIKNALKPFVNYYVSLAIFMVFYGGGNLAMVLFVLPVTHVSLAVVYLTTLCLSLVFLLLAMCRDPGYLRNNGETIL
jgi:hypothetical protein